MEENREEVQAPQYKPRPKWQIALAWVGIAIMVVSFLLYCMQIAMGGL